MPAFFIHDVPPLTASIRAFVREGALIASGDRVVAAVSGGSDSVALLRLLIDLAPRGGWAVVGVVHVNHGLRGAESNEDAAFCRRLAAVHGLPIHVVEVDTRTRAATRRQSIEAAARDLRYAEFEEARRLFDATHVATGHTLDDQAETVLLRLFRGAGSRGLAGIRARRGPFVRPLLRVRRAALRGWLSQRGQAYRDDASNEDREIPRNRIRHDVLPAIETATPGLVAALGRTAALAAEDDELLERLAIETAATIVSSDVDQPRVRELDSLALVRLPRALARRIVRRVAADIGAPAWSERHVAGVLALAGRPQGRLDLPGATAIASGATLRIHLGAEEPPPAPFAYPLTVPGGVDVPEAGVRITAAVGRAEALSADAVVVSNTCEVPFCVRSRRPGDRFRPWGAPGSRKLQDLLVDRKIPRRDRDRVPLVVDGSGRILWVVGVVTAEACRGPGTADGMVTLTASPLVGER